MYRRQYTPVDYLLAFVFFVIVAFVFFFVSEVAFEKTGSPASSSSSYSAWR